MTGFTSTVLVLLLLLVIYNPPVATKNMYPQMYGRSSALRVSWWLVQANFSFGTSRIYLHTEQSRHALRYHHVTVQTYCSYVLLLLILAGNTGFSSNSEPCKFPFGVCNNPNSKQTKVQLNAKTVSCGTTKNSFTNLHNLTRCFVITLDSHGSVVHVFSPISHLPTLYHLMTLHLPMYTRHWRTP